MKHNRFTKHIGGITSYATLFAIFPYKQVKREWEMGSENGERKLRKEIVNGSKFFFFKKDNIFVDFENIKRK